MRSDADRYSNADRHRGGLLCFGVDGLYLRPLLLKTVNLTVKGRMQ